MNLKSAFQTLLILLFILPIAVFGQISKGGIPVQIQKLKSSSYNTDLVIMPTVENSKMKEQNSNSDQNVLKPFRFAYSFNVSLNLNNSGTWYNTTKVNVWQLRIRSSGAYSLNLIFDQYRLPEDARLFLISEKTGEIKGAYTSDNNSESKTFAIEPVEGDELLIQYEEPVNAGFRGELQIAKVAHDYVGILYNDHRPLGSSGACNVNANCDIAAGYENVRDGVCRIIIAGTDLCTGVMVNNTAMDGTPYVLTAFHCINSAVKAQSSIFLFNYESPYCSSIDGDVSHSLSGSSLKASFDSLDFALVRLNNVPPDNFRPYLVGWNRKNFPPVSSICIHHPLGDIKKIAIDNNAAVTAKFNNNYYSKGFWNILRWEYGVTEVGSSGGPLFDQNKQLIGTLTGGSASCPPGLPTNDYFEKFALAWDYRKDAVNQLKAWLDPINSNIEQLDGIALNSNKTTCTPETNFKNTDTHTIIQIPNGITKKGYWSGSNLLGFTEFAEQFTFSKSCEISGISLGVAKAKLNSLNTNSYIDVRVYEGTDKPEKLIYTEKFNINKFYSEAMNSLSFASPVKTTGNFFVSYNISKLNAGDTLVVYMANRKSDVSNSFYLKNTDGWSTYNSQNLNGNGSALLVELIACNIDDTTNVDTLKSNVSEVRFFPNPISGNSILYVETVDSIDSPELIEVYDLLGKKQNIQITQTSPFKVGLNFSGKRSGIYFIHLESGGKPIVGKIAYLP
jgi:lysyl endopeptidase